MYKLLDIFGSNVVTTEHAEWRRHRKIVAPQFSERNNMYVHRQTVQTVHDMFRSWQTGIHGATANTEHELHINVSEDMAKLALYRLKLAFDEFEQYSSEMIRDTDTQTDANLLVSLTKAARADTDIGGGLTERELIGNIFILMFAG
ncbi:hypothetical protein BSLG_004660 [Batrachochytrium salamandrivorans]|nr:hypothetical protein BSLG_004660 [Batrachochytrium salamandrivorans]